MKKILIIEDDPAIAKSLVIRLRAEGYVPLHVSDSVNGLTMARQQAPDLILLDISLPGGDGFKLAERLSGMAVTSGLPIIYLTASRKEGLRERAMDLGAVGFFEKPYEAAELLAAIRDVIGDTRPTATS